MISKIVCHDGSINNVIIVDQLPKQKNPSPHLISVGDDRNICINDAYLNITFEDEPFYKIPCWNARPEHPGHRDKIYKVRTLERKNKLFIITASEDRKIKIFDYEDVKLLSVRTIDAHSDFIHCLEIITKEVKIDGEDKLISTIISGSYDRTIKFWDFDSNNCLSTFIHDKNLFCLTINGDDMAVGCGTHIIIWDVIQRTEKGRIRKHKRPVIAIKYAISAEPDVYDTKLISTSDDKTLCIWDPNTLELIHMMETKTPIYAFEVWNNDPLPALITGAWGSFKDKDHPIHIYDLNTLELIETFNGHRGKIMNITAWHTEKQILITSASKDESIRTFDLMPTFRVHLAKP